jgi:hypothetical protein
MVKGFLPVLLMAILLMFGCERRQDPPPEPVPPTTPTPTTLLFPGIGGERQV